MKKILILFMVVFVLSCTAFLQKKTEPRKSALPEGVKKLSKEEQQKKAMEDFTKILDFSSNRSANLEKMASLYIEIIEEYPDAPLAQESYWRLIDLYLKDFNPPRKEDALFLYRQFDSKYPDSKIHNPVESTITGFLYRNGDWTGLLAFEKPHVEKFIKTGKLDSAGPMFLYSEAKLKLNDLSEAYKGFKVVVKFFPNSPEGIRSKSMLSEIEKIKTPEVK